MKLDLTTGLLVGVRYVPSPNWDYRPAGGDIDLLVIHNISLPPGEFGGPYVDALFTNNLDPTAHPFFREINRLKVSSHLFLDREGEVTQYVPLTGRAWHAGESCFQGRECCNDFSIGIELEGTDEKPYAEIQYRRLANIIHLLNNTWPGITRDRIVGHSDIAPQRKTDPGRSFDWVHLYDLLGVCRTYDP